MSSRIRSRTLAAAVALSVPLGLAACSDSPAEPPTEEVTTRLVDAAIAGGFGLSGAVPLGPTVLDGQSIPCPLGGEQTMQGSMNAETDGDAIALTWDLTVAFDECARQIHDLTIVTNGSSHLTGSSRQIPTSTPGERPTLLSYEGRQTGQMTTTVGDRTTTCDLDTTMTFDPETKHMRVRGILCGRAIDIARPI